MEELLFAEMWPIGNGGGQCNLILPGKLHNLSCANCLRKVASIVELGSLHPCGCGRAKSRVTGFRQLGFGEKAVDDDPTS